MNAQVYDVAAVVASVTTVANVMRVETDQQGLRVTQSFFIKNDSNPPRTQFSKQSYDFYLPPDAQIEGSAAMAPGGMPSNHRLFLWERRVTMPFFFLCGPELPSFSSAITCLTPASCF